MSKRFAWIVLPSAVLLLTAYLAGQFLIIEKPLPHADAIFVLSGSPVFAQRTNTAAASFELGLAKKIVLTTSNEQISWDENGQRIPFGWEWERWNLISKGVPADAIEILPGVVQSTQDEAVLVVQTARQQNWHSVLLVTSPFHTRRALWMMNRAVRRENVKLEIGILSAAGNEQINCWWLNPRNWLTVISEYVKFVYDWLFY